jgi:hypothetical protein
VAEAKRCFNCGVCNDCELCLIFCPDVAIRRRRGRVRDRPGLLQGVRRVRGGVPARRHRHDAGGAVKKVMVGNHAVSLGVKLARAEVISAYPITPQTQIVEMLSEMCGSGELDARYIKVESEHSAMAACLGASATGVRTFTATSSQGLALMHELLHWAGNGRHPVVMANVNRAMGPGLEHLDGPERLAGPARHRLDPALLRDQPGGAGHHHPGLPARGGGGPPGHDHPGRLLPLPHQRAGGRAGAGAGGRVPPRREARLKLDTDDPHAFGALVRPDDYMEMRWDQQEAMARAGASSSEIDADWRVLTGRSLGRPRGVPRRRRRAPPGHLRHHHLHRPGGRGPAPRRRRARGAGEGQDVPAVPHRRGSGAALRGPSAWRSWTATSHRATAASSPRRSARRSTTSRLDDRPTLYGYVLGLGGRDVTPATIDEIIERTRAVDAPSREDLWVGVKT